MRTKTLIILVLCLLFFSCGKPATEERIVPEGGCCISVSPKGNVMAFLRYEGKYTEAVLKSYAWDISEKKTVRSFGDGIISASSISWSPDGRKIAGVGFAEGKHNIWIFDPWGEEEPEMITDYQIKPNKEWIASDGRRLFMYVQTMGSPTWSPTGELIAFCYQDRDTSSIWVVSLKDKKMEKVTPGPGDYQPCFSPDGSRIIYSTPCTCEKESEIMEVTLKDKSVRTLISSPFFEVEPAWSPDGKYIAFVSNRDGSRQIWIRSLPDSLEYQFTWEKKVGCYSPAWTPDGKHILYVKGGDAGIWMKEFDFEKLRTPPVISLN